MDPDFYYRRPQQLPPASAAERDLSWKCEVCGYHVLSMDQSGKGLPLEAGPSGKILPLMCPRCRQEHTHWTPVSPFDAFGDHANLPSALSSRVTHGASVFDNVHKVRSPGGRTSSGSVTGESETLPLGHAPPAVTGSSRGGGSQHQQQQQQFCLEPANDSHDGSMILPRPMSNASCESDAVNATPGALSSGSARLTASSQALRPGGVGLGSGVGFGVGGSALEYEHLADHDALKDPDVVAALQRLRRRRGVYDGGAGGGGGGAPPSTFASFLYNDATRQQAGGGGAAGREALTDDQIARLPESSLQRAAAHRVTAPKALETYVCGLCSRRLLRIDHKGDLIPIEVDAEGNLTKIECPGCHHNHTQWHRVQLNGTASIAQEVRNENDYYTTS